MAELDNLKILIDQYVRAGMTEARREELRKKASEMGINIGELLVLIKSAEIEIAHVTGKKNVDYPEIQEPDYVSNNSSGFVSDNQSSGFVSENQGSGFVSENQGSGFVAENQGSGFIAENQGSGFIAENQTQSGMTLMSDISATSAEGMFSEVKKIDTSGAMSDIYSAMYFGRKKVIIKRIKSQYNNNSQYKDLFYKEFDNAFSLDHANIVQVYGKGEDSEGPFYYMEYVDGRSLAEVINIEHRQEPNFVRKVLTEILEALSYVHKKQIFHRDLKPENILITYKGDNVKLIDFGLATADGIKDNLKQAGTPKYSAPELISNANSADQRSDIYSLGMIILEWLAGAPDRRKLLGINNLTLRQIAEKSTMMKPNERYSSCDEILSLIKVNNQPKVTSETVPNWLSAKIREFASDGVITRNERKMIDIETQKNGIDVKAVEVLIDLELEKAREKMQLAEKIRRENLKNGVGFSEKRTSNSQKKESHSGRTFFIFVLIVGILAFLAFKIKDKNDLDNQIKQEQTEQINNSADQVFKKGEFVYTKTGLNLRQLAAKDSKILLECPKNTKVEVLNDGYYWVEVLVNNKHGYMAKQYLSHSKQ
ncbi:MAG: serine/threonine protein kinase [Bacteroidales bacterium]|nr:serine/threonine protein kinase [Bacteroidales bacterium]